MIVVFGDWRSVAIRGLAALVFGILVLIWPDVTLWALVILFGVYALVDGIFTLAAAFRAEPGSGARRGPLVLAGLAGIVVGVLTFVWPDITALALLWVIAAWALLSGVSDIAAAVRLRRVIHNEWLLILTGAVSIVFAVVLVITPGAGALVITWLIGWYGIVAGALLLALAWRLRQDDVLLDPGPLPPRLSGAA